MDKERDELKAILATCEKGLLHMRGGHLLVEHSRYGGWGVYMVRENGVRVALRASTVWGLTRQLEVLS